MVWSRVWLEVSGPLAPYYEGFTDWLVCKGYAPTVVRTHQRRLIHLSRWMQKRNLGAFGPEMVNEFVGAKDATGRFKTWRAGSWAALLEYLRSIGVPVSGRVRPVASAADVLLARYGNYEAKERSLSAKTVDWELRMLRPFVASRLRDGRLELENLTTTDITAFVVRQSRRDPKSVPHLVTPLRSLLRYLHVTGVTPVALATAVPSLARWRLAGLPKALPAEQVAALLATCDPETEAGQRDTAILTVMSRLGLRVGEIAGLLLEDIDWRNGELAITGKGRCTERLPLPADVGQAIVSYLTGWRPETTARHVFVRACAPHGPMAHNTVSNVVARAARKAGLGVMHAHRLRHSAATAMLTAGASLEEIGQVLRHRDGLTTMIYAKVDVGSLRQIARGWPVSGAAA